ncbi:MAG: hypothetical protein WD431_12440 [Cyclobacteriaceae bacterium]
MEPVTTTWLMTTLIGGFLGNRTTFVSNVIQLAQQLSQTTTLDSDRLQKARALFEEGKYQELNKVLNEEDIDRNIAQYEEKGKILANELTIKAQTTVLTKEKGWFEEKRPFKTHSIRSTC